MKIIIIKFDKLFLNAVDSPFVTIVVFFIQLIKRIKIMKFSFGIQNVTSKLLHKL